ncbi:hypothetical protein [Sphingomonas sp.]|jgi:hypothetical protein|uniref:hypothetical protein n=1 Tax=Sphingomonas sp. TaxID=28214 RepID=UPI0035C7F1D6
MKTLLPIAAAALLAACNSQSEPEVLDSNPDPMATELANRAPVELPPAIKAEKSLRCKDNSLVYVTFFQGDKQANVRTEKGGTPTVLKAPNAGEPLVAEGGWSMTGTPDEITLTQPGKSAVVCHG